MIYNAETADILLCFLIILNLRFLFTCGYLREKIEFPLDFNGSG